MNVSIGSIVAIVVGIVVNAVGGCALEYYAS